MLYDWVAPSKLQELLRILALVKRITVIFIDAGIAPAEKDPQMPNLPSSTALLGMEKGDREVDGNFEQLGREKLDQHRNQAIEDLPLTELTPRTKTSGHQRSIVFIPTANALNV